MANISIVLCMYFYSVYLVYSLLSSFSIVKGMNFTMTNSPDWLPHFPMDYGTSLWLGLCDKIFWDVNWVHGMYPYSNGQDRRRMKMQYNMTINDYHRGQVNTLFYVISMLLRISKSNARSIYISIS